MKPPPIPAEVRAFHNDQIVVDLHVDTILQRMLFRYDMCKRHRAFIRRQPLIWHTDIPRMQDGGYSLAVLGVHFWPWESKRAWKVVRKQLAYLEHVVRIDERVVLVHTADDVEYANRAGKLAFMAGIEGAHMFAGSLDHVEEARARGVVYVTLAHFSKNSACTPGMGRKKNQRDGLTAFGRELVQKLNEQQILVDVAHVNRPGVLEACELSTAPVIASHTNACGIRDNRRGLTDEGIEAIATTGGVVGVIFAPIFLRGRLNGSLDHVVEHMAYIADLVGPKHVAIGTDFDGWIPTIPNDIRDCRDLAWLTHKLLKRGFSKPEVAGILGKNFLRVLSEVRGPHSVEVSDEPPPDQPPGSGLQASGSELQVSNGDPHV